MFTILNRLRGTYGWFSKINGALFGLLIYTVYGNSLIAILVALGYVFGESFGWGEWVGTLTSNRTTQLGSKDGINNGIAWLANKIVPEHNYRKYCQVALFIRGLYWWIPTLLPLYLVGINILYISIAILLLALAFPVSCYFGYKYEDNFNIGKFSIKGSWETQEFYYGIFQDLVIFTLLFGVS